ncbi:MAG TPA: isoprenylcysteine carboxylmethyltransferase family protein [Gemmatimonadales bacterium]|nr:isoprenylcysteine carboxylmethyltransferase family protein [Gemmatimonadales bacterium]
MPQEHDGDVPAVSIFPPFVPTAALVAAVLAQRIWPIDAGALLPSPWRYWIGGAIILLAMGFFAMRAVRQMRRSGQSEVPWTPVTEVLQSGPYSLSRNPMYLFMVVACIGFAVLLANPWLLLFTPMVAWALQKWAIIPEEEYLERTFGEEYAVYRTRVRRWI